MPIKAKLILDHVRIAGSILILPIFQKEEVAGTGAKAKMGKALFGFQRLLKTKIQKFKRLSYLQNFFRILKSEFLKAHPFKRNQKIL